MTGAKAQHAGDGGNERQAATEAVRPARSPTALPAIADAVAAAVLEETLDCVFVLDEDGYVAELNPAAERTFGYVRDEALGEALTRLILPSQRRSRHHAALGRPGARGAQRLLGRRVEMAARRSDGSELLVELTLTSLRTDPPLFAVFLRDVTQPHRDAEARELLATASAAFDSSLDPSETMRTIAQMAIPGLAELCTIDLVNDDGTFGDSVVAADDDALASRIVSIRSRRPIDPAGMDPVARALRVSAPVVIYELARRDPSDEIGDQLLQAGYRRAVVMRLVARGRLLGALSLLRHGESPPAKDELGLMRELADRAAMALDNATLYAERTRVAQTLQRSLLPEALPRVDGLEIASAYHPVGAGNEVGGDFYDVFELPSGCWLTVGDVCGKGTDAAAITALVRHSIRALAFQGLSPAAVLAAVNDVMLSHDLRGRFATAVVVRIDLSGSPRRATLASAGHPPPLVLDGQGMVICPQVRGVLLGVIPHVAAADVDLSLPEGSTIVLHTDGLLDAGAPSRALTSEDLRIRLEGERSLTPAELVASLERIAQASGAGHLRDDIAILAARIAT